MSIEKKVHVRQNATLAPCHKNNSWWECVGHYESVKVKIKNLNYQKKKNR